MGSLVKRRLLFISLFSALLLVAGCGPPAETPVIPAPAPAPPPPSPSIPTPEPPAPKADTPCLSPEEAIANIWTRLPEKITGSYNKSLFDQATRIAKYEGNGKWAFEATGKIKESIDLPARVYMETRNISGKQVEAWFEELKRKTVNVDLKLMAVFYENSMITDAVEVKETSRQETTDIVSNKPLKGLLQVEWITATYSGAQYHIEGSVKNIGKMRLLKVQIEIADFNDTGKLVQVKAYPLSIETINPDETAHFRADYLMTGKVGKYDYRFFADNGPDITYRRPGEPPPPSDGPKA